jgi:hypothetical protein
MSHPGFPAVGWVVLLVVHKLVNVYICCDIYE